MAIGTLNNAGTLANLAINITGNSNQLVVQLGAANNSLVQFGKQATGATSNAKSGFHSMLGVIARLRPEIAALTAAITGAAPMVRFADNMEAGMRRLKATFGSSTDAILQNIDAMKGAFAAPQAELVDMAATAGRVFQGLGISAHKAAEMTAAILKRSQDMAADGTMDQGQAIKALIDAVRGGGGALSALGAEMTEAEIHAKAMELGFVRAHGALTDTERAIVRFAAAMDGTKGVEGAAEDRADSYAAAVTRLQAALADLGNELGVTLIPTLTLMVNTLTWTVEHITALTKVVREFMRDAGLVVAAPFVGIDAGEMIVARDQAEKEQKAADDKRLEDAADARNKARNVQLQEAQQLQLFHRGVSRTSLGEFAKTLQGAGFKQRGTAEQQLDVLKQIKVAVQKGAEKLAKPNPNNAK